MSQRGAPDRFDKATGAPTPPLDKRWPEWLSAAEAAAYLSFRGAAAVRRLAKLGRLPKPSMHLGPASPRWSREQIDELMHGRQAQDDFDASLEALIHEIQSRPKTTRRRKR